MAKYIFTTGGVSSSLGKGMASAALGALLQSRGLKVKIRKFDPYLNVDPGTMNPLEHGEVFVTADGAETDLDLGHYERFTGSPNSKFDSVSSGQIYQRVITAERKGEYLGQTVMVIPHVTDMIKYFIKFDNDLFDIIICEIGGTVGDIEALPFLEAVRQMRNELGANNSALMHVTLLPYLPTSGELKTKPSQHSVQALQSLGLRPDILLCRAEQPITDPIKAKLALYCNVNIDQVIAANNAKSIYAIPEQYHLAGLDTALAKILNLEGTVNITKWQNLTSKLEACKLNIKIAVVGKYVSLKDAYKSLIEAITHCAIDACVNVEIVWINSKDSEFEIIQQLSEVAAIIVPGGFGESGIAGKLTAITFARTKGIPFLGICLGMQLAVVEAARNLLKLPTASSTEFGPTCEPVVALMTEWQKDEIMLVQQPSQNMGATMRLGDYICHLKAGSLAQGLYQQEIVVERHRHRYEVNCNYIKALEAVGLNFSGFSPDGLLPEIVEIAAHPFFIACQFHPELISNPFNPHPLFKGLIRAAKILAANVAQSLTELNVDEEYAAQALIM